MTHSSIRAAAKPGLNKALVALFTALVFAICSLWTVGAMAQDATERAQAQVQKQQVQPLNNSPVWSDVATGNSFTTVTKGRETGVLINKSGETWRQMRNDWISYYGGWVVALVFLAIMAVYFVKGPVKLPEPRTGKLIERFTSAERLAHWTMAFSFVALAVTGLLLMFGKYVLASWLGLTINSWLAQLSILIHNFVGPLFAVSIIVFFIMYVKDNLPEKNDIEWLKKGGGLLGNAPAGQSWGSPG
jgi:formate dehydrogenase subunit gamma